MECEKPKQPNTSVVQMGDLNPYYVPYEPNAPNRNEVAPPNSVEQQSSVEQPAYAQPPVVYNEPQFVTEAVQEHLGWSIFNCLCCCWILGIIAIVYSMRTSQLKALGRHEEAVQASEYTKGLNTAATILGIVALLVATGAMLIFTFAIYH